ncbi:hypothetical protein CHS0354_000172 [Potamilus streckersoni]|uniref:Uncharacterized protein n=1 Tax=Potamilus streckersoni TaxID=2493646 RepID=A0AAE0S6U4_9BIVA|nr:hypothetical protein CHS0354_000172 [Potamilus streckersoni]
MKQPSTKTYYMADEHIVLMLKALRMIEDFAKCVTCAWFNYSIFRIISLGADHDGFDDAVNCSSEDHFIMASHAPKFTPGMIYTRNPWMFSNCSLASFQKTLVKKQCAYTKYMQAPDIIEQFKKILKKQPGQRYTLDEQCHIINGQGSVYCGVCTE